MLDQKQEIDLGELSTTLWADLDKISGKTGLLWSQVDFEPWWQKLGYSSEEEARIGDRIEDESKIRDYRKLVAETLHFNVSFVQGSSMGSTYPQSFDESLGFVLKKEAWENQLERSKPPEYAFIDNDKFSEEMKDYLSSPKFFFKRHLYWNSANIELSSELVMDKYLKGRNGFHEIPEAEKLVRTIVAFSENDDIIFNGEGVKEPRVVGQMAEFKNNLQAAYGIVTAQPGFGIIVSPINRGT